MGSDYTILHFHFSIIKSFFKKRVLFFALVFSKHPNDDNAL